MSETQIDLIKYISDPKFKFKITTSSEMEEVRTALKEKTSFLPDGAKWTTRAWHILHGIYETVKCTYCGNPVKWDQGKYRRFCSNKCVANSEEVKKKKEDVSLEKYGTTCSFLNEDQKNKRQKTIEEKYGVSHVSKAESVKQKKRDTLLKNFGVENVLQSEVLREKMKQTLLQKYGVEFASKLQFVKDKSKNTCIEKYGVDSYVKTEEFKKRYAETCLRLYGDEIPGRTDLVKEKSKKTSLERYGKEYHVQCHISDDSLKLLNDPEWLELQHHSNKLELEAIGQMLGVDGSTIGLKCKQFNIPVKRYFSSILEKQLREHIETIYKEGSILYGDRKTLSNNKELDIYLPEANLAIEFNGLFWHSEFQLHNSYHYEKYHECREKGIRLIQIFEDEWKEKNDIVKTKLRHILRINTQKVYARKCSIIIPSKADKKIFFETNHIQGDGDSSIDYCLVNDKEIVACMAFKKRNNHLYELNRYATSKTVCGGFSKLLNHFSLINPNIDIVSFADLRWSNGDLYKNNGFMESSILPPDYFWIKRDKRIHKFNFRRGRLKNKLDKYDENLTEVENMHNNNYYRIYDAGKLKYFRKVQQ